MNRLILAVAGSRKTQSIVDACLDGSLGRRRLVLTYTITGQAELAGRLRRSCKPGEVPEVMGWFAFLLRHCVRPYLPLVFPGRRLMGLNFQDDLPNIWFAKGQRRFFDREGRAYSLFLSRLAVDVAKMSNGAVMGRLSRIYDEIYIDEVQDLTGCDLYVLEMLMASNIDLTMVGDIRQSIFDTNPRDPNLKQFRGVKMLDWFRQHQQAGRLQIANAVETWRSNQLIADFSDTLFPAEFRFEKTVSVQNEITGHDGVFAIARKDLEAYLASFDPLCLRPTKITAAEIAVASRNFGKVKGLTTDRVLILPTGPITAFLTKGTSLKPKAACGLYVAVTRARHSIAFLVDNPSATRLQVWVPPQSSDAPPPQRVAPAVLGVSS